MKIDNVLKNILNFLDIVVTFVLFSFLFMQIFHWSLSMLIAVCVGEKPLEHWAIQGGMHEILAILESFLIVFFLYKGNVKCYIIYFLKRCLLSILNVGIYFSSVNLFHLFNGVLYYRININSSLFIFPLILAVTGSIFWYFLYRKELRESKEENNKFLKLAVMMMLLSVLTGAMTNFLSYFLHYNLH